MTALTPPAASPFDAVRRVTSEGREYWCARELMPLLGYAVWRDFANAISRARAAALNAGYDITSHFAGARKVAASGPAAEDYHLSRLAGYLIAMNGDPRKPEVAAAQTYFAIRTREAEVAKTQAPAPAMPTHAEALRGWAEQLERADRAEQRAEVAEERVDQLEPAAVAWEGLAAIGGDYEVADAAKILSRDPGIGPIGRDRLFAYMNEIDWVFRGRHNRWRAYQDQVDLERLIQRPGGRYFHRKSGEFREGDPTVLVTAKGLAELRRRLTKGQLALVI